ncbi:MAG TPA: leucyl aminopeptidase [Christensenellaceae bacterium]|nr:leucyl aminopeptidase [Christensenellaceae bacterium]
MKISMYNEAESGKLSSIVYLYHLDEALEKLSSSAYSNAKAFGLKGGKLAKTQHIQGDKVIRRWFLKIEEELCYDNIEEALENIISACKEEGLNEVSLAISSEFAEFTFGVYKKLHLANDGFTNYVTSGISPENKPADKPAPLNISLCLGEGFELDSENKKLEQAKIVADGISLARRLVNEPANVMTPDCLANEAKKHGEEAGFSVKVYNEKQIVEMNLHAFYSVAKGSDTPPRFIVMEYNNAPDSDKKLALVGKGLMYDSGGYAIKPGPSMYTMFCDMAGAAAVIGAMYVLAKSGAKANVFGIVAACENMVSGHAYRNGDIIPSHSGKYIEIINTDAEGRLTLADAISYAASTLDADAVIDIATLTGAAVVALGDEITALLGDDEKLCEILNASAEKSGDKIWRLPAYDCIAKNNKSERADIKNSGGRLAGTAIGGLFCRAFAHGKPWAHLDIAGTAYHEKPSAKAPLGATGIGVEMLARAAEEYFK